MNDEFGSVPSDTSKVQDVGGNRHCKKCGMGKQWRNREWVCLNCDNATPADWSHPMSHKGLTVKGGLGEKDSVKIVQENSNVPQNPPDLPRKSEQKISLLLSSEYIEIPQQAREIFQRLSWNILRVQLTKVQAENLLSELESMDTPTKMSDAKAIIKLVEALENQIKQGE